MLRITPVGANAVDYLVRGSNCAQHEHGPQHRSPEHEAGVEPGVEHDPTSYYLSATGHGEAPGVWMGSGLDMLGHYHEGQAVAEDDVRAVFGRLEHPQTGERLGRKLSNYQDYETRLAAALEKEPEATPDRQREIADSVRKGGQRNVAYYDLTFSPPKTFSTQYAALLAAGRVEEAATMRRIQSEAVKIAMDVVEEHAGYTRVGYHGKTVNGRSVGEYQRVQGMVMTAWEHSTNREAEPQIHTHVAVLNRAETTEDGKIRALDGKAFRPIKEAVASAYERAVEDLSREYLGYEWVTRPDGKAREIAGADLDLAKQASTRRAQVEERAAELIEAYVDQHGHEPTAAALKAIHQAATLETRKAKGPEAGPAAVKSWADRHHDELLAQLDNVEQATAHIALNGHPDAQWMPDQADREAILRQAVQNVQLQYPTWSVGNLTASIDKLLLRVPGTPENRPKVVAAMAREALRPGNPYGVLSLTPPDLVTVPKALRRAEDDRSKYRPHIDELYTTSEHLSTERRIVAGAAQLTAPKLEGVDLQLLRTEVEGILIGGKPIGADQVEAILGIASSGRAGDVLIGPAGAGKSTVVGVLAKTWEDRFGGRVLGLATSQRATQVLLEEGLEAINTAAFLKRFTPDQDGVVADEVRPGDLIVIDESGMSSTPELARISAIVEAAGGKLLYTGDHHQLGAVGAGGMLNLLATDNGKFELEDVHRFRDAKDPSKPSSWEGKASLRLREGDSTVLSEYDERGRLRGGTVDQMQAEAMRAYLADTIAGLDSLLVVATNAEAAELSKSIRDELVMLGRVEANPVAHLNDKTPVSIGDVIQARRNDWRIEVDGPGMVTNRLTYTVVGRDDRGRLLVEDPNGVQAHLPDAYVREHVTLAYASTVHAAQGRTVDTSHALLNEKSMREDAYVAMTRGKQRNVAYLATAREPDAHEQGMDVTPAEQMAAVLDRSGSDTAAELEYRASQEEARSLSWLGGQWDLVSKEYSRDRYTDVIADLIGPAATDALIAEEAYPALIRAVRLAELSGHNPDNVLAEVVNQRELGTADSVSAVLRHRLNRHITDRTPEQQVDGRNWTTFAAPMDGPVGQFMHELAVMSTDRQNQLAARVAAEMPAWAQHHLGAPPEEPEERVTWLHRAGVAAAYRELHAIPDDQISIGPAPSPEQEFHRALWKAAHRALGSPEDAVDYQGASEAQLRELRATWTREQAWAPAWVADELKAANDAATEYRQDAILGRAHLATMTPGSPEYETTRADTERVERLAAEYAELAYQVDEIHRARQAWYAATEPARVADQLAADELERRNLPLQPATPPRPEQTELFKLADDEHGRDPEQARTRPNVEPEPRAPEVDPANQPAPEAEPVDHVRWWQRWADAVRGPAQRQDQPERVEQPAKQPEVPAAEMVRDPEQEPTRVDDPDQLTLLSAEATVEDRVLQRPLRVAGPERVDQVDGRRAAAEAASRAEFEQRVTLAEELRAARAAEAQRQRRETAEAARQAQQERAEQAERVAVDEAERRASRDRAMDSTPRQAEPAREQRADDPGIELVQTPAAERVRPLPAVDDDFLQRHRWDPGPRLGPDRGGPSIG